MFYSDSFSLYERIFKAYLHNKIQDKWIIQGMVSYNRSNKHFQDIMKELMELITEGE